MKSAPLKTQRVFKPPKKVFLPRQRETPQQKVQNSRFSHFSGASATEKNQNEGAMLMQFILTRYRMQCCALRMNTYIYIYICMHECIFLSGRGCIADVVRLSSLELLTLSSYLRPSML